MTAREVNRHHLCQGVDIQFVARGAVAQRHCNGDGKLLEHRVENCESRHELRMRAVAVVDLAYRSLVDRTAEIHLKDLGIAMVLPCRGRVSRCQANTPGANELLILGPSINFARDFGRPGQVVDEHGVPDSFSVARNGPSSRIAA